MVAPTRSPLPKGSSAATPPPHSAPAHAPPPPPHPSPKSAPQPMLVAGRVLPTPALASLRRYYHAHACFGSFAVWGSRFPHLRMLLTLMDSRSCQTGSSFCRLQRAACVLSVMCRRLPLRRGSDLRHHDRRCVCVLSPYPDTVWGAHIWAGHWNQHSCIPERCLELCHQHAHELDP